MTWTASQAPLAGEADPEGRWSEPHAVLEVSDGISRSRRLGGDGRPPVRQGLSIPIGDESVIAVVGEEGQLGTGGVGFTRRTMSRTGDAASGSLSNRARGV